MFCYFQRSNSNHHIRVNKIMLPQEIMVKFYISFSSLQLQNWGHPILRVRLPKNNKTTKKNEMWLITKWAWVEGPGVIYKLLSNIFLLISRLHLLINFFFLTSMHLFQSWLPMKLKIAVKWIVKVKDLLSIFSKHFEKWTDDPCKILLNLVNQPKAI